MCTTSGVCTGTAGPDSAVHALTNTTDTNAGPGMIEAVSYLPRRGDQTLDGAWSSGDQLGMLGLTPIFMLILQHLGVECRQIVRRFGSYHAHPHAALAACDPQRRRGTRHAGLKVAGEFPRVPGSHSEGVDLVARGLSLRSRRGFGSGGGGRGRDGSLLLQPVLQISHLALQPPDRLCCRFVRLALHLLARRRLPAPRDSGSGHRTRSFRSVVSR